MTITPIIPAKKKKDFLNRVFPNPLGGGLYTIYSIYVYPLLINFSVGFDRVRIKLVIFRTISVLITVIFPISIGFIALHLEKC